VFYACMGLIPFVVMIRALIDLIDGFPQDLHVDLNVLTITVNLFINYRCARFGNYYI